MSGWSACVEWLFADEHDGIAERIRAAGATGLDAVEFWRTTGRDLDAISSALEESGLPLAAILCEPIAQLTDPATHAAFLAGVERSLSAALRLGAPVMIAQAGNVRDGVPRGAQHAALVEVLGQAAALVEGSGVVTGLEPLNDRVDHIGYYLTATGEGLDIVDEVGRREVGLVYDIYHSAMMGERTEDVLAGRADRVVHAHLADVPGRHEPGSGTLGWRERVAALRAAGYEGLIGLEYRPSGPTRETLAFLRA